MAPTAAQLLVNCLSAEGVTHVFGIPGEETLDLNAALEDSDVRFVPVRHEQGGAYIADVHGRLTGRAGVCLGTLGPGATNLATAVADAFLDRAPLVALTGQADLERQHKESHQYIDVVSLMRPITKWNARLSDPAITAEVVRKAFKVAESEKPGSTHVELPEDVMGAPVPDDAPQRPLMREPMPTVEPPDNLILEAAAMINAAERPIVLAGNGVVRARASGALREFSRATQIPVAETFMGKGLLDAESELALGAVGLQAGDFSMAGFDDADLVIAVGYDLVEHSPALWNPNRDRRIICVDSVPAETDEHFIPEVELIGHPERTLSRLTEETKQATGGGGSQRLREAVIARLEVAGTDDSFPMVPPRALLEIRRLLGREDILVSDVGLHKLWIGRLWPAQEPNTVLIANGLAGMGFAVPAAIAAKLVNPNRKVVAISGDGGFLMNAQELETARRLGTGFVNVVWEDRQFGSIAWKQRQRFGETFGTDFENPDFVGLAESFGLAAWRCDSVEDYRRRLTQALALDEPSLIVVPIDYSPDLAIAEELGAETVRI
ncbi:MAG TPA: acetolactate synthase large subunit [Solirubrobacterales bacterium]|nr:acetolactate synthase large subunit [Solirubrobacterales bacterium]